MQNISNTWKALSQRNKALIIVIGILVLVDVGGYVYYTRVFKMRNAPRHMVITDTLPAGYDYTVVAQDKYPAGFPVAVVTKSGNPVWQRGEDTTMASGTRLRIVELLYTRIDPPTLMSAFEKTFKADGWSLKDGGTILLRTFSKAGATATVSITPKLSTPNLLVNITLTTTQ